MRAEIRRKLSGEQKPVGTPMGPLGVECPNREVHFASKCDACKLIWRKRVAKHEADMAAIVPRGVALSG